MSEPMGGVAKSATGTKYDAGKPRMDLLPMRAVLETAKVLAFGAKKYGANNWRKVLGWRWRYTGAGLRHVAAYVLGETHDAESGLHHLSHALCCFMFVLDNELTIAAHESGLITVPDGDAVPLEAVKE